MGQRLTRVNELVKREISMALHADFNVEAVRITITDVDVSPNLRSAMVFYSVLGGAIHERNAALLFKRSGYMLQNRLAKNVTIKYTPILKFTLDRSMERGNKLIDLIDEETHDLE